MKLYLQSIFPDQRTVSWEKRKEVTGLCQNLVSWTSQVEQLSCKVSKLDTNENRLVWWTSCFAERSVYAEDEKLEPGHRSEMASTHFSGDISAASCKKFPIINSRYLKKSLKGRPIKLEQQPYWLTSPQQKHRHKRVLKIKMQWDL